MLVVEEIIRTDVVLAGERTALVTVVPLKPKGGRKDSVALRMLMSKLSSMNKSRTPGGLT